MCLIYWSRLGKRGEKKKEEAKESKTAQGLECSTLLGEASGSRVEKKQKIRWKNTFFQIISGEFFN